MNWLDIFELVIGIATMLTIIWSVVNNLAKILFQIKKLVDLTVNVNRQMKEHESKLKKIVDYLTYSNSEFTTFCDLKQKEKPRSYDQES